MMSREVESYEYNREFALGDIVSFNGPYGDRLVGEVVRVYNARADYHVEVDGKRYSVHIRDDDMQYANR